jgi:hypothetical protein
MSELDKEWMNELNSKLDEMDRLMLSVPSMIRRMTELQQTLRNQYGERIADLRDAMDEALNSWMASNC